MIWLIVLVKSREVV